MKNKIFKMSIILVMILTMTMTNFIFVGASLISYATDDISTNHKNVEFEAYFKEGEKDVLYLRVNVNKEGYFNGNIQLVDSNFKLKESNSEYVNKIENNTITLNQINAGTTAEIEIEVVFEKNPKLEMGLLTMQGTIQLNGIYKDSSQKDKEINATKNVTLELNSDVKTEDIVNDLQIITNKILQINGENKRVLQVSLKAGLKENNYPIKNIEVEVAVSPIENKQPIIKENARLNNMSNQNFTYDGNVAKISMMNENNQWKDTGTEEIILTYIYDEDTSLEEAKIVANQNIELSDGNKISAVPIEANVKDNQECDSIISVETSSVENDIYKGKLYAGIDRTYGNTTTINVNLVGVAEEVEVQEQPSTYIVNDTNREASIYYTQTKINKQQLIEIIGEQGSLTITDQEGNAIQTIDANTEADQEGNIAIIYNEDTVRGITIRLKNIEKIGTIQLEHSKVIKKVDKQTAKMATAIETNLVQRYMQNEMIASEVLKQQRINLIDTKTEAKITMNKSSLSTLTTNNVEIKAILKSAKEENDLYKNPKVQIILPEEIKDIKINSINKVYAEELEIEKAEVTEIVNLGKVIELELSGQQTNYLSEINEGAQILINADITFDITVPTKKANIAMKYTNENGNEQEYETSLNFDIISKYGVLVHSKVDNYKEESKTLETISNENLKGGLDIKKAERIVTIKRDILNNYEEPITNVALIGTLSEEEEEVINGETLKSTFLAGLENIETNLENTKIYYSENGKEWRETIEEVEKVKFYKIELQDNCIQPGELLTIDLQIKIPENLAVNQSTYEKLNLSYQYKEQVISDKYAIYLSTNGKEIETKNPEEEQAERNEFGEIKIKAISAGKELKDGQEVYEGQTIKQIITITNDTGKDINNLKMTAKQDHAIFYTKQVTKEFDTLTGEEMDVTRIVEDERIKQQEMVIETLKNGESISVDYQFSAQGKVGEKTEGTVMLEADGIQPQTIETIANPIKEAKIKLNVVCNYNEERTIIANSTMPITLSAKNLTEKELNDVIIELPIPEGVTFTENYLVASENYTYIGIANHIAKFKINAIKPEEQVDIILSVMVNDFKEQEKQINIYMQSTIDNETYVSNELSKKAVQEKLDITVVQTGSIDRKEVATGDNLTYTANIKNMSDKGQEISIIDHVPSVAVIQKAYVLAEGKETAIEKMEGNEIETEVTLKGNSEIQLVIETRIDEKFAQSSELTNTVEVNAYNQYLKSNKISYKLANIPEENPIQNEISGKVWLDENKNGRKEADEKAFSNVVVKAMDLETGNIVKEMRTNHEGKYQFTQLPNGKYIIIVEYDSKLYSLTEYKKKGIDSDEDSDAIEKEINGQKVAVTDEIHVDNNNTTNIDVGLTKNAIFDLKLDKYINRVIVQNKTGTKTIDYNKEKLAKVEIDAKQVNNATVLVEYGIDITNEGEIAGYASEIVDHMPNDFKFNSELNKSWYTTGDKDLHNITLANEIIYPGETKTITITLIKTMTQNNAGTFINTAEIAKASNEFLVEDIDSTPANNASNEDDISTAELIVSIRTGLGIAIGVMVSFVLIGLVIIMIIIIKKRRDGNE